VKTILIVCDTFGNVHRFDGCGIRAIDSGSTWEVLSGDENIAAFFGIIWYKYDFEEDQGPAFVIESLPHSTAVRGLSPWLYATLPILAVIPIAITAALYKIYGG
jgi:hypothetical protein